MERAPKARRVRSRGGIAVTTVDHKRGWAVRVQRKTTGGDPVTANGITVTPITRALLVGTPFFALVWNRPTELRVDYRGQVGKVRIVDFTRAIQVGLLASSTAGILAVAMLARRRSEER